jgi:hypothetical protein
MRVISFRYSDPGQLSCEGPPQSPRPQATAELAKRRLPAASRLDRNQLRANEPSIEVTSLKQLRMMSDIDKPTTIHDNDAVAVKHGGKTVGDYQDGTVADTTNGICNSCLGLTINLAGGLVKDQE